MPTVLQEWKRYRKISAPAFSEVSILTCGSEFNMLIYRKSNNKLVWDESVRVLQDMIDNVWKHADTVSVDHALEMTVPVCTTLPDANGSLTDQAYTLHHWRGW